MTQAYNQLTPTEAERLALVAEECGEVVQAIGKILRHGYESTHPNGGPTNRESLERELGDLIAVIGLLNAYGDTRIEAVDQAIAAKHTRLPQFLHHQNN